MMKLLTITIVALFFFQISTAQVFNNWYFGNQAAISFNPGNNGIPSSNSTSVMNAPEGCSSVSDIQGNILFYTNGKTIYNKHHRVMQNGDSLSGHVSAFQSSLIVPQPGSDNIYYLFTTDAIENSFANGYRYSIIDMSLNGGDGSVTNKNVLLYSSCTERLAAIRHANGIDVWVITNDKTSNSFRAWLVNCTGLQPNAVVSNVGVVLDLEGSIGAMKSSPDGTKLCQTQFTSDEFGVGNYFQLFDFNANTGVLSNARSISSPPGLYYNSAFSPDSRFLYATRPNAAVVDQFDISQPTTAQIISSKISIPADFGFYGIQLAADKKIYLSRYSSKLAVINQPDIAGIGCQLQLNKIAFVSGQTQLNLPNAINDWPYDPYNNFSYQLLDACIGTVQFNAFSNLAGPVNWLWDFGDGTTSTVRNPLHSFIPRNQVYKVTVTIQSLAGCGKRSYSQVIAPVSVVAKAGFSFNAVCDSGYVKFTNQTAVYPDTPVQYVWEFDDGSTSTDRDPVHTYAGNGVYNVKLKISTGGGCTDDSISIPVNLQLLDIHGSPPQTIDEGETVQIYVTGGGSRFEWSPATWLSNPNSQSPFAKPLEDITYAVTAYNDAGCKDQDSVTIHVNPLKDIFIPTAFTPNNDGVNDNITAAVSYKLDLLEFSILNRWGQVVFTSKEKWKAWDGTINGRPQPTDSYIWIVRVKDRSGKLIVKKGSFLLIR
jgi:gliding motility-associated-like protein